MASTTGQTAVIVPVPGVEPLVHAVRDRFDPAARQGVPAHVTLLYPFLPVTRIDDAARRDLAEVVAAQAPFEVTFARCARFDPDVVHLVPEPAAPFRDLTLALVDRWPEAPPYGGRYGAEPVPHLTLAQTGDATARDRVEREVGAALPVVTRVAEAVLIVLGGGRWTVRLRLPFVGATAPGGR